MTQLTPAGAVVKLYTGCFFVIITWLVVGWAVVEFAPW